MPNPFYSVYPSETDPFSDSLYPMYQPGQEIMYLSWDFDNVESGRKYRTFQSISADEIKTTVVLCPNDAIGNITDLAWYGGHLASLTLGTGQEIDKQEYLHDKNVFEIVQVTRVDTKGW
jgi:hypothetical protein